MAAPAASQTLEQMLRDCFQGLEQSPDNGSKWAKLAATLWVKNVPTLSRNLQAHRSSCQGAGGGGGGTCGGGGGGPAAVVSDVVGA